MLSCSPLQMSTFVTFQPISKEVSPKHQYSWMCTQHREHFQCLTFLSGKPNCLGIFCRHVSCSTLVICLGVQTIKRYNNKKGGTSIYLREYVRLDGLKDRRRRNICAQQSAGDSQSYLNGEVCKL